MKPYKFRDTGMGSYVLVDRETDMNLQLIWNPFRPGKAWYWYATGVYEKIRFKTRDDAAKHLWRLREKTKGS